MKRKRIWVRTAQAPTAVLEPLESTNALGGNQGNLLFQFSVYRSLLASSAELTPISYGRMEKGSVEARADRINSNCDHLVLPLSSSFRLQMLDTLHVWSDLVERLTIPVTVVGIGAQVRLKDAEAGVFLPSRVTGITASNGLLGAHDAAVRRFVSAVLERSASVGVRGEVTSRYLQYLGFPQRCIDVIGCPSLYMYGPGFEMPEPTAVNLTAASRIALSFDHRIPATAAPLQQATAEYPKSTVYAQEKLVAQMVISGVDTRPQWQGDRRFPVQVAHPLYREHRLAYCQTAWSWIRHLEKADFAFGPRLHGTVAAILAGTPAHLLAHDSRTLEVAQFHRIPHTVCDGRDQGLSLRTLASETDYAEFNELYPARYRSYTEFLRRNGLVNAYDRPSDALARFDSETSRASRPRVILSAGRYRGIQPGGAPALFRKTIGRLARRSVMRMRELKSAMRSPNPG